MTRFPRGADTRRPAVSGHVRSPGQRPAGTAPRGHGPGPHPASLRRKTEEERQRKEDERARREFIRQEYLRRKQLKLMEDMDTVLKPRAPAARQKKPRPKSIHRDHVEPPRTPTQGPPGNAARARKHRSDCHRCGHTWPGRAGPRVCGLPAWRPEGARAAPAAGRCARALEGVSTPSCPARARVAGPPSRPCGRLRCGHAVREGPESPASGGPPAAEGCSGPPFIAFGVERDIFL